MPYLAQRQLKPPLLVSFLSTLPTTYMPSVLRCLKMFLGSDCLMVWSSTFYPYIHTFICFLLPPLILPCSTAEQIKVWNQLNLCQITSVVVFLPRNVTHHQTIWCYIMHREKLIFWVLEVASVWLQSAWVPPPDLGHWDWHLFRSSKIQTQHSQEPGSEDCAQSLCPSFKHLQSCSQNEEGQAHFSHPSAPKSRLRVHISTLHSFIQAPVAFGDSSGKSEAGVPMASHGQETLKGMGVMALKSIRWLWSLSNWEKH